MVIRHQIRKIKKYFSLLIIFTNWILCDIRIIIEITNSDPKTIKFTGFEVDMSPTISVFSLKGKIVPKKIKKKYIVNAIFEAIARYERFV